MMEIVFSYPHDRCPRCNSRLKTYRVDRRRVKDVEGEFTALSSLYCMSFTECLYCLSQFETNGEIN